MLDDTTDTAATGAAEAQVPIARIEKRPVGA